MRPRVLVLLGRRGWGFRHEEGPVSSAFLCRVLPSTLHIESVLSALVLDCWGDHDIAAWSGIEVPLGLVLPWLVG